MKKTITQTKICTKCKIEKDILLFSMSDVKKGLIKSSCKQCLSIENKKYYDNNGKNIQKEYYIKNKEKIAIFQKQYHDANKDKKRQYDIEYRKKNKRNQDIINANQRARRRTKEGRALMINYLHNRRLKIKDGDVSAEEIIELQNNSKKCYWCNKKLIKNETHIDHYIPIAKGGKHTISNLVISCQKCNQTKSAKDPICFANSLGRLL